MVFLQLLLVQLLVLMQFPILPIQNFLLLLIYFLLFYLLFYHQKIHCFLFHNFFCGQKLRLNARFWAT